MFLHRRYGRARRGGRLGTMPQAVRHADQHASAGRLHDV
jgi:hypothetical protein